MRFKFSFVAAILVTLSIGCSTSNANYTITFDRNGATDSQSARVMHSIDGPNGVAPSSNGLSLPGYTFVAWNTRADGTGVAYRPGASLLAIKRNTTLFATWKAIPLKVTQSGDDTQSVITIEWHDGSKQDIVYSSSVVGLGYGHHIYSISGGLALMTTDEKSYQHTCYPNDYLVGHKPVMKIWADKAMALNARGSDSSSRTGTLADSKKTIAADEVKMTVSGRLINSEADTQVEITMRADAPRMIFSHAKIRYTKTVLVKRIYHQLLYANPADLSGSIRYIFGSDGRIIEAATTNDDMMNGLFYATDRDFYVGFVASRVGSKDFLHWHSDNYYGAYKILYDDETKVAGDVSESKGVTTWGYSTAESRELLDWANDIRQGKNPGGAPQSHRQRAISALIKKAF